MGVHPPHKPILSWGEFFVHIATIVVGLLIAIGLEQTVEWFHHRHLLHTAERNLSTELATNRELLRNNQSALDAEEREFTEDLQVIEARGPAASRQLGTLHYNWHWDKLAGTAWDTARNAGAVALMPYDTAQAYSTVFTQQELVNRQATAFLADIYRSEAPLLGGRTLDQMTPADLDAMASHLRDALADAQQIRDLCRSLDQLYNSAPRT